MRSFIKTNIEFWCEHRACGDKGKLLVECSSNPVTNHSNAVMGKAVAAALSLKISWLITGNVSKELMQSYEQDSVCTNPPNIGWGDRLKLWVWAVFFYWQFVLVENKLLDFEYRGVVYGDFVYDAYLARFKKATLHRFDLDLVRVFYQLLFQDLRAREVLSPEVQAVLVSHHIGLGTGPLTRVALSKGVEVYWKGAGNGIINLTKYKSLKNVYDYPKRPSRKEVVVLSGKRHSKVKRDFQALTKEAEKSPLQVFQEGFKNRMKGKYSRKEFLELVGFEDRPIIFVIMHAFNDHPHSHFEKMLFDDYYCWFAETLEFAKAHEDKNWIFKEHPSIQYYPTNDVHVKRMMLDLPEHIRFFDADYGCNSADVLRVADMVTTCLGSVGVEFAVFAKKKAVIAGDSAYSGFGFTLDPKQKRDYFALLASGISPKLTQKEYAKAVAFYTYFNKYSNISFHAGPELSYRQTKDPGYLKREYYDLVLGQYQRHKKEIYKEFKYYVDQLREKSFERLVAL